MSHPATTAADSGATSGTQLVELDPAALIKKSGTDEARFWVLYFVATGRDLATCGVARSAIEDLFADAFSPTCRPLAMKRQLLTASAQAMAKAMRARHNLPELNIEKASPSQIRNRPVAHYFAITIDDQTRIVGIDADGGTYIF